MQNIVGINFSANDLLLEAKVKISCVSGNWCDGKIVFSSLIVGEFHGKDSEWVVYFSSLSKPLNKHSPPEGSCSDCGVVVRMTEETAQEVLVKTEQYLDLAKIKTPAGGK